MVGWGRGRVNRCGSEGLRFLDLRSHRTLMNVGHGCRHARASPTPPGPQHESPPMTETTSTPTSDLRALPDLADARAVSESILFEVRRVIVGQDQMLERILVGLLSGGHILLEGVPGLAKTLTIKTLADVLGGSFKRIQFTPDLMPSDLVGTRIYRPSDGSFETELGPVFANFLLADEINRAPAKVQSALLEVMQEHQVTIGGDDPQGPRAVHRPGHREPDRGGGHLPAAGGPGRPVHAQDRRRLPGSVRGGADRRPLAATGAAAARGPRRRGAGRAAAPRRRHLRRPADHQLRRRPGRGDPQAHLLGRPGARGLRRLRRQPARLDQPRPWRPRPGRPARPALRPAVGCRRAGPGRPAPPPRPVATPP